MNLILIGMPGSGKSTCGILAAKALCMDFLDSDILIQKKTGMSLQKIINSKGYSEFEKIEEETILSIDCHNTLIATGGSVIYYENAISHLKQDGKLFYLHLDFETMKNRIDNIDTRGIVFRDGQSLSDMYYERLPMYDRLCDAKIPCSGKAVEQTVSDICRMFKSTSI